MYAQRHHRRGPLLSKKIPGPRRQPHGCIRGSCPEASARPNKLTGFRPDAPGCFLRFPRLTFLASEVTAAPTASGRRGGTSTFCTSWASPSPELSVSRSVIHRMGSGIRLRDVCVLGEAHDVLARAKPPKSPKSRLVYAAEAGRAESFQISGEGGKGFFQLYCSPEKLSNCFAGNKLGYSLHSAAKVHLKANFSKNKVQFSDRPPVVNCAGTQNDIQVKDTPRSRTPNPSGSLLPAGREFGEERPERPMTKVPGISGRSSVLEDRRIGNPD